MPLRDYRDLVEANAQLTQWVMSEAGNRIHDTARTPPLTRFIDTEQAMLKLLPSAPPKCARWTQAKSASRLPYSGGTVPLLRTMATCRTERRCANE